MNRRTGVVSAAALACLIAVSGCASAGIDGTDPSFSVADPIESVGRHP